MLLDPASRQLAADWAKRTPEEGVAFAECRSRRAPGYERFGRAAIATRVPSLYAGYPASPCADFAPEYRHGHI